MNELVEAADEKVLAKTIARYGRVDLLCFDELGYMELDRRGAELLFQVLTEREEKNSIAIDGNESFSDWTKTFTDPRGCRLPPQGQQRRQWSSLKPLLCRSSCTPIVLLAPCRELAHADQQGQGKQYDSTHHTWQGHIRQAHDGQTDEKAHLPPRRPGNRFNRLSHGTSSWLLLGDPDRKSVRGSAPSRAGVRESADDYRDEQDRGHDYECQRCQPILGRNGLDGKYLGPDRRNEIIITAAITKAMAIIASVTSTNNLLALGEAFPRRPPSCIDHGH